MATVKKVAPIAVSQPNISSIISSLQAEQKKPVFKNTGSLFPLPKPPSKSQTEREQFIAALKKSNKGQGHSSLLGSILDNLGSDVIDTIKGIPGGMKQMVEHPVESGKAIVKSYEDTYGNGFGHFAHVFKEHPLGPILDALTVVTGGAGALAKGGKLAADAGILSKESKLATLGKTGTNVVRSPRAIQEGLTGKEALDQGMGHAIKTSANPVIRFRQNLVHRTMQSISGATNHSLETVRFGTREVAQQAHLGAKRLYGHGDAYHTYTKAFGHLKNDHEREAANTLLMFGDGAGPKDYANFLEGQKLLGDHTVSQHTIDTLKHEKTQAAFDEAVKAHHAGTEHRILTARDAGLHLGVLDRSVRNSMLSEGSKITDKMAQERAYRSLMVLHGNEHLPKDQYGHLTPTAPALHEFKHPANEGYAVVDTSQSAGRKVRKSPAIPEKLVNPMETPPQEIVKRRPGNVPHDKGTNSVAARLSPEEVAAAQDATRPMVRTSTGQNLHGHVVRVIKRLQNGTARVEVLHPNGAIDRNVVVDQRILRKLGERPGAMGKLEEHLRSVGLKQPIYQQIHGHAGALVRVKSRNAKTVTYEILHGNGKKITTHRLPADKFDESFKSMGAREARASIESIKHTSDIPREWAGGTTLKELADDIEQRGGIEPTYLPHVMNEHRMREDSPLRSIAAPGAATHEDKMLLFHAGQLALNQDMLGPRFQRTLMWAHAVDVYEGLKKSAVVVKVEDWKHMQRQGYVVMHNLSRDPGYMRKHQRDFEEQMAKASDSEEAGRNALRKLLTKDQPEEGEHNVLMVPRRLLDMVAKDYHRTNMITKKLVDQPLTMWKSLILGWSPRFAVNNVVGNTMLAAMRFGGPVKGMKAVFKMAMRHGGMQKVADMLNLSGVHPLSIDGMRKFFPEHIQSDFAHTEIPRGQRKRDSLARGPMHAVVGGHENIFRRKLVNSAAREEPEIAKVLSRISSDRNRGMGQYRNIRPEKDMDVAMAVVFKQDPGAQERISSAVDDALGNYRSFTASEDKIRRVVPFYSWYRHIARSSAKLVGDKPGTVNVLANVGKLGSQQTDSLMGDIPEYLRSYMPLGGVHKGHVKTIGTESVNPLNSIIDVGKAVNSAVHGDASTSARDVGSMLNPFLGAGIEQMTHQSLLTGRPLPKESHGGLIGNLLTSVVGALPQAKLAGDLRDKYAPKQKGIEDIYTHTGLKKKKAAPVFKKGLNTDLLAFLGTPIKDVNLQQAHESKKRSDAESNANGYFRPPAPRKKRKSTKNPYLK